MQNSNLYDNFDFYIFFPAGYKNRVSDVLEDIIDIYYVEKNDLSEVYIGTFYTIQVLNKIFSDNELFIAEKNMVIIKDLRKETIYETINIMYQEKNLKSILSKSGAYKDLFGTESVRYDLL